MLTAYRGVWRYEATARLERPNFTKVVATHHRSDGQRVTTPLQAGPRQLPEVIERQQRRAADLAQGRVARNAHNIGAQISSRSPSHEIATAPLRARSLRNVVEEVTVLADWSRKDLEVNLTVTTNGDDSHHRGRLRVARQKHQAVSRWDLRMASTYSSGSPGRTSRCTLTPDGRSVSEATRANMGSSASPVRTMAPSRIRSGFAASSRKVHGMPVWSIWVGSHGMSTSILVSMKSPPTA